MTRETNTDPIDVYVLVEDKGGNLSFYPWNAEWQSENAGSGATARRKGAYYVRGTDQTAAKPIKYSDQDVSLPRARRQGGRFVSQSTTIAVQGSGKVHVYLAGEYLQGIVRDFADTDCQPTCANQSDVSPPDALKFVGSAVSDAAPENDTSTVRITFLGSPSLAQEDTALLYDHDDDVSTGAVDPNDSTQTDPASALGAFKLAVPGDVTAGLISSAVDSEDVAIINATDLQGYLDDLWVQKLDDALTVDAIPYLAVNDNENRVFIIAEVRDDEGNPLSGGSNVDSGVTFSVMFHADSDLKNVARVEYSEPKDVNAMGRASIELTGWTTNADRSKVGSVRVTVTATYSGPSGNLDLGKVELARSENPPT